MSKPTTKADTSGSISAPELPPGEASVSTRYFPPLKPDTAVEETDYESLGVIGRGGMGIVEKVKNRRLGRIEARKTIRKDMLIEAEARSLFQNEIHANARLRHPGIVTIYGAGIAAQFGPFYTMEFVEGGDLSKWIDQQFPYRAPSLESGPLSRAKARRAVREAGRLLQRVAEAVEHMHQREVWHRDLKPTNILLEYDRHGNREPQPKVTDFGLAVLHSESLGGSSIGGTPYYMPPEQVQRYLAFLEGRLEQFPEPDGKFFRLGDIYSMGAVFYEMLTGRPPFPLPSEESLLKAIPDPRNRNEAVLRSVVDPSKIIKPPRQINPQVDARLEAICLKCLSRKPKDRYQSAGEVARDLERALRPTPWGLLGLIALVFLLVVVLGWSKYAQSVAQEKRGKELLEKAEQDANAGKAQHGTKAIALLQNARDGYDRYGKEFPQSGIDHLRKRNELSLQIGKEYFLLRHFAQAHLEFNDILQICDALAKEIAADVEWQKLRAETHHAKGLIYQEEKKVKEALNQYIAGRNIWQKLLEQSSDNSEYRRRLARSYGYIGDVELEMGRNVKASDAYDESEQLRAELVASPHAKPEDHYQLGRSKWNTGNLLEWQGNLSAALQAHEKRLQYLLKENFPPPPSREFQVDLPSSLIRIVELRILADTAFRADPSQGLKLLETAEKKSPEEDDVLKTRVLLARAYCYWFAKERDKARAILNSTLNLLQSMILKGKAHSEDYFRLARAHALLSQIAEDPEKAVYHENAAVLRLHEAIQRGFRQIYLLEADPGFSRRLRAREDFTDLLDSIRAGNRLEVDSRNSSS